MAKSDITAARLREVLDYNPETGIFTWRIILKRRNPIGSIAGSLPASGYRLIGIDGTNYRAHRLAWLYVHGEWPKQFIDHIDGDRLNNAIANLRDVSNKTNTENITKPRSTNGTGFLGVVRYKDKFSAFIKTGNKNHYLGAFNTPEEAHATYLAAKRYVHKGFVRQDQ